MMSFPDDPETQAALDRVAVAAEDVRTTESRAGVPWSADGGQLVDTPSIVRPFKVVATERKAPHGVTGGEATPLAVTEPRKKQTRQQRKDAIYDGHVHGASLRQLARMYGISLSQAKRDFDEVNAKVTLDDHETAKRLLWERLEMLTAALMPKALAGNVAAVHEVVVVIERQARLIGADMPVKVASTTPDGNRWAPLALTLEGLSVETLKALRDASDVRILTGATEAEIVNE
jgi:hypothetical protein